MFNCAPSPSSRTACWLSCWALALLVVSPAIAQPNAPSRYAPYPEPGTGYVTDLAGLLSAEEQERIEQRLWTVEEKTGVEIVVVLIESMAHYPQAPQGAIEPFATGLFDAYGIGNLPANDGVLLLVARRDRQARIELGQGYGRHRDADAMRIMQRELIPAFKRGDYAGGVADGADAIMLEFAGVRFGVNWALIGGIAAVPIFGLTGFSLIKSGRRGWGWVFLGTGFVVLLVVVRGIVLLSRHTSSGAGHSSGWSSGGFGGGFGGGSSGGGGGASGSW